MKKFLVILLTVAVFFCHGVFAEEDFYAELKATPEEIRMMSDLEGVGDNPQRTEYNFQIISKNINSAYDTLREGIDIAVAEYAAQGITVNYVWDSPAEADAVVQIQKIENAAGQQPDAMGVIPVEEDTIRPVFAELTQAGIPVLSITENVAADTRTCFTGHASKYQDGWDLAEYMAKEMNYEGQVIMLVGSLGTKNHQERANGAKDCFAQYEGIEIVVELADNDSMETAITMTESALSTYPDAKAIFSCDGTGHIGAGQVLLEAGIQDDYIVCGFDFNEVTVAMFQDGGLDAVYAANGLIYGYYSLRTLVSIADGEVPYDGVVDTGAGAFITADDFMDYVELYAIDLTTG